VIVSAAKNDWGAIFWGFCFLSFWARKERLWLVGLAAGSAFSAKYTEAFFLLPLLAWAIWEEKKNFKQCACLVASFACVVLPLALRNAVFIGNPFFPALTSLFPSLMGPSWKSLSYYEGFTLGLSDLWHKIKALMKENQLAPLSPFFLLSLRNSKSSILLASILLSSALFALGTGPKAEWRLMGCALILLSIFGFSALERGINRIPRAAKFAPWAIFILCIALAPLDWMAPLKLAHAPDPSIKIRESVAGAAIAWVRMNAAEDDLAATLNEQRIYYFLPLPPIRAFDWPDLDKELSQASSPQDMVKIFQQKKIRYLILSGEFLDRFYDRKICDWMFALSETYPRAVVFRAPLSRVLDLSLLP
jgi:hypothetical protein